MHRFNTTLRHKLKSAARFAVLLTPLCLLTAGHPEKIARDLKPTSDRVDVVVQFSSKPEGRHHQKIVHLGGTLKTDLSGIINASHY